MSLGGHQTVVVRLNVPTTDIAILTLVFEQKPILVGRM